MGKHSSKDFTSILAFEASGFTFTLTFGIAAHERLQAKHVLAGVYTRAAVTFSMLKVDVCNFAGFVILDFDEEYLFRTLL